MGFIFDLSVPTIAHHLDSGMSDPYVTVVYARQGKPLYSTRIIFEDLNPCFEETAAVLVDANAIKIREKLCLQLWDSDRASAVSQSSRTLLKESFIESVG